jgi:hypothetical protein
MGARKRSTWFWRVFGVALISLIAVVGGAGESQARLDPYYVLRGLSNGDVRPRVLFVVDTSGSMSWRANAFDQQCNWGDCETQTDTRESRISAARRVINQVISDTGETASFALMTFDQYDAPTWNPARCAGGARFTWVTFYGYFVWAEIWKHPGVNGTWRLCQGNEQRPYPYMRWNELGVNSPINANNQTGDIPPSPLIGALPQHNANAFRRVQWFPQFMGVRTQLNLETDPDRAILNQTYGDFGTTNAARNANVWNQDFYYWPYVDGFPHYAGYVMWPYNDGADLGGVVGQDPNVAEAKLYAPFYLDLSDTDIDADDWGPSSPDDASAALLAKTGPMIEGGIDAAGGTPWASVVGQVGAYPRVNTEGSHRSVASYLSFVTQEDSGGLCAPTAAVLITDGVPSPASEGGATLYRRLAALRNDLGVKTYVVGFFQNTGEINNMACAAAGACDGFSCTTPCNDGSAAEWDTCRDPDNPGACAYLANSTEELGQVLTSIVTEALDVDLPSGPGTTANEFGVGAGGVAGQGQALQTVLDARTNWPGWRGHLERRLCEHRDEDGELLPQCTLPSPEWEPAEVEHTFGPCPQSHEWDAGECLANTVWSDRRVFTTNSVGTLIPVTDEDGNATGAFRAELQLQGIIFGAGQQAQANEIAAFMLGRDWPDGWKLPGLASSTPTLVRRVPALDTGTVPSVPIRDPHCGGRRLGDTDAGSLPQSLEDFARDAWDTVLPEGGQHYEYQEAVLIGDDLGMLHAFQYNSGNELWGYIPNAMLQNVADQSARGAESVGQPEALDEHDYGISATVNAGFVYDDSSADPDDHRWRQLAVFGFGPGGSDYVAIDVSHMSPASPRGPLEVLWSTDDPALAATYDPLLGETWARPALTYHVPGDEMSQEPDPFLVVGSGYGEAGEQGRALLQIDALTGELLDRVDVGLPAADTFEDAFGLVSDAAVGTHCLSRFWAEAQETYITDPSGRFFRWDLGRTSSHEADSQAVWEGTAQPVAQFNACVGSGSSCTVSGSNPGEPFAFAPAVTANDRIDDQANASGGLPPEGEDQFLVALISGAHNDSAINPQDGTNTFHSSLYLFTDDHRAEPGQGFNIPAGAPKMAIGDIGSNPSYLRLALSDITRTRRFTPFPGASEIEETRSFSPSTRPIRAPRIVMRGVVDNAGDEPQVVDGVEVAEVTYFVHEPPVESCDPRFYDPATETWYVDQGATFQITFQLTVDSVSGFNFSAGAGEDTVEFADPGFDRGLNLVAVAQDQGEECEDGNCGPKPTAEPMVACDNNEDAPPPATNSYAVPVASRQLPAFTPVGG